MADDIVERLRKWDDGRISTHYEGCWDSHPVCAIVLAADAIEALTAERDASRLIISDLTAEVERLAGGPSFATPEMEAIKVVLWHHYTQLGDSKPHPEDLMHDLPESVVDWVLGGPS